MGNLGESLTQEEIQVSGFRNIFEIVNTNNAVNLKIWQFLGTVASRKRFRFIRIIENVKTINPLNLYNLCKYPTSKNFRRVLP